MRSSKILLALLGCLFFFPARSQTDSCNLRITLLTCGPGQDLYSLFGHTGLRVVDPSRHTDIVFNYGTFEFDEDFYVKFINGILIYAVGEQRIDDFMEEYQTERRSVIEQELMLNCSEKRRLYDALRTNALPQNKSYNYLFLFDNCSTRPRDMVKKNASDSITFKRILPEPPPSFRDMLHVYLENGHQYWSEFGIDLALGSRIDRKVENEEAMFLPDYLMKGFDSAVLRNQPLVGSKRMILPEGASNADDRFLLTPLVIATIIALIGLVLTLTRLRSKQQVNNIFDGVYFSFLGLLGCFLLFMWLGTDHELCRDNYNILWALPSHIVMVFFLRSGKRFVSVYFLASAVICLILMLTWAVFPQTFNIAFFPLVLLAGIRSWARAFKKR